MSRACSDASECIGKNAKLEEILQVLEAGLYGVDNGSTDIQDGSDVMERVVDEFVTRANSGGANYISTGIKALDNLILGCRGGKMVVIAGRPSMGKTALADSIRRAVIGQGYGALTFSLEMASEELCERELAYQTSMNLRKISQGKNVTAEEIAAAEKAKKVIDKGLWKIDDKSYSISAIRRRAKIEARKMAKKGKKLKLVILDYIQLAGDNGEGREQSVAAISRGCKMMAKELDCTVLALSQLNRLCELREDKRPMMSDLRESGAIEQDADIVLFVYREHVYDMNVPPSESELIVRKHRSGPLGTVRAKYVPETTTFTDHV